MSMRVIADGGSTKVHWRVEREKDVSIDFFSGGVNPMVMPPEEIMQIVENCFRDAPEVLEADEVEYYGAGCKGSGKEIMTEILHKVFQRADVRVGTDMEGAARVMLDDTPGIACILGTGANSCLWSGDRIIANTPPLGYILGDEGSGAWIGRRLVSDRMKGLLPRRIAMEFDKTYPDITEGELISRVYRPEPGRETPNRFLASFVPFVREHISDPSMQAVARDGFTLFIRRNILQYLDPQKLVMADVKDREALTVNFVGGVACAFREILCEVLRENHLTPGVFYKNMFTPLN